MNDFLDDIRAAFAADATDASRERGAQACRALHAILSTPAGAPLVLDMPPLCIAPAGVAAATDQPGTATGQGASSTVAPIDVPSSTPSTTASQAAPVPAFDAQPVPTMPLGAALPPAAAAAVALVNSLRHLPPEQLLELAITRMRAALPADVSPSAPTAPVRFHFIPLPPVR